MRTVNGTKVANNRRTRFYSQNDQQLESMRADGASDASLIFNVKIQWTRMERANLKPHERLSDVQSRKIFRKLSKFDFSCTVCTAKATHILFQVVQLSVRNGGLEATMNQYSPC